MQNHHKRSSFSGKLGFVLSAAGASVGLGNIWRFPYLAAKYGGGIFLLIYIILALTLLSVDGSLNICLNIYLDTAIIWLRMDISQALYLLAVLLKSAF